MSANIDDESRALKLESIENIEFDLRLNIWKNRLYSSWVKCGQAQDLEEFTLDYLNNELEKQRLNSR